MVAAKCQWTPFDRPLKNRKPYTDGVVTGRARCTAGARVFTFPRPGFAVARHGL
jgi:hypothetical protein